MTQGIFQTMGELLRFPVFFRRTHESTEISQTIPVSLVGIPLRWAYRGTPMSVGALAIRRRHDEGIDGPGQKAGPWYSAGLNYQATA